MHQIICTTSKNFKTKYRGRTYAKNEHVLEPGWISDAYEFREPELYKIATTVTCDDENENMYYLPVG